ncbi:Carbon-nitrogen hydrolase [Entomophthora muscae]|uniref:Carbon-nitrogen hydrolase n=1 Tax=Entomophthora muscae TaxID=34485 RepID=A0ACC2UCN2_9FUNG|nr:Carbon-nitrogen hydrolase [Entomophthora muscae]
MPSLIQLVLVQYSPIIGDISSNIQKVDSLLQEYLKRTSLKKDGSRIIILPELSLTGYLFESIEEITPFIEPTPPLKSTLQDSDLVMSASIRWAHENGKTADKN